MYYQIVLISTHVYNALIESFMHFREVLVYKQALTMSEKTWPN